MDICERPDAITITAELPGLSKNKIDIELTADSLSISGERRRGPLSAGEQLHRAERPHGPFSRSFSLRISDSPGVPVDTEGASAQFTDGVLTLDIPKAAEARRRDIPIDASESARIGDSHGGRAMRSDGQHGRGSIWDVHDQTFADIGRALREAFGERNSPPTREARAEWAPPLDFSETPEAFIVRADLPGIAREAIDVTTDDDALIIRGDSRPPEAGDDEAIHRRERRYGRFYRALTLPAAADVSQVSARLHDGVLEVTIAKTKGAKPRRIEISS